MTNMHEDDFRAVKHAILTGTFTPLSPEAIANGGYPPNSVGLALPSSVDPVGAVSAVDTYTAGNSGAIVGSQKNESYLILPVEAVEELRANLRAGRQIKQKAVQTQR